MAPSTTAMSNGNNNKTSEADPLLSPRSQSKFYFINKQDESYQGGTTSAVKDSDGVLVVEGAPKGSNEDEFAPRVVVHKKHPSQVMRETMIAKINPNPNGGTGVSGFFSKLFGNDNNQSNLPLGRKYGDVGTIHKPRKAPVKIEPKVFFANERTFLAWLHISIILAGASIAIVSMSENNDIYSQLYGIILLPVAISFIIYSMYQYGRRARLIRHRLPGPYEDTVGPTVLGIMLMLAIVAEFALKLYAISQH